MTHDRHLILSVYDVICVNTGQEDKVPTGLDDTDMFPRQDKQSTVPSKKLPKTPSLRFGAISKLMMKRWLTPRNDVSRWESVCVHRSGWSSSTTRVDHWHGAGVPVRQVATMSHVAGFWVTDIGRKYLRNQFNTQCCEYYDYFRKPLKFDLFNLFTMRWEIIFESSIRNSPRRKCAMN